MKKNNLKIIGIFVCILFLGTLLPTAVAEKQTDDQIQPTGFLPRRSMVFGHISKFSILGNIIIGHADQLVYFGKGILNLDRGIIIGEGIILRMTNRCHILTHESDLYILGYCFILLH